MGYLWPGAVVQLTNTFGNEHGRLVAISNHFYGGVKKGVLLSQGRPPGAWRSANQERNCAS